MAKEFRILLKGLRIAVTAAAVYGFICIIHPTISSAKDYTYALHPPADKPLQGKVTWYAEVFAPGGVTTQGLSIHPNPNDVTQVTIDVDNSVVGDVILYASYSTPSGVLVAMEPFTVVSIRPAAAQTGIELQPSPASIVASESIQLELNKLFADGTSQPAFISGSMSAQFSSSNANVARVNSDGVVYGISAGQAVITASFNGYTTQVAATVIDVGHGRRSVREQMREQSR